VVNSYDWLREWLPLLSGLLRGLSRNGGILLPLAACDKSHLRSPSGLGTIAAGACISASTFVPHFVSLGNGDRTMTWKGNSKSKFFTLINTE